MKILIIKKKSLILLFIVLLLIFLIIVTEIFFSYSRLNSQETLYPLTSTQNYSYDFNGDGSKDNIQIVEGQNKIDICIKCANEEYYLSKEIPDNILFTNCSNFKPKIFVHDLSRNSIPEIILTGQKDSLNVVYIFQWNKGKFNLIYNDNKNIFGILNCKNSRTPQCYSLDNKNGLSSLNSFMIINNSILDTTIDSKLLPSVEAVTNFINLIELPYPLDELPEIFSSNINRDELSLLWNLDKDNFSYSFQNGFFYDYEWDDSSIPVCIKWRLLFKKDSIKEKSYDKKDLSLLIDLHKDNNTSSYKISSIQLAK
ncbi:MAG: hypothetical protein E7207_00150 [Clostridium butyricum]|nr:hypothetical protein [Clostridium butyricum]